MADGRSEEGKRGKFLVLDGIDGCGKSTQARRLVQALTAPGRPAPLHLREPGSTGAGERIRAILLEPGVRIGAAAEALLFTAARRQMLDEVVRPALAAGRDVVCERFHASTFAYQGVAGETDEEELLALLDTWAGEPAPDLTVLLHLDPARAAARWGDAPDRIEARGLAFQERVAAGFARYAACSKRVAVVPADGTVDEVATAVLLAVRRAEEGSDADR